MTSTLESAELSRVGKVSAAACVIGVLYFLLIGGTPIGQLSDTLRVVNSILAAAVIIVWLRWMSLQSDWIDRIALGALLIYLTAAIGSSFPRQSFEAATAALAYTAIFYVARRLCWFPGARQALLSVMALACSALAIGFAVLWLAVWGDWLSLTKWTQWPPISIALPTTPFWNRYDVEFLVLLLAPAVILTGRGGAGWMMRSATLASIGVVVLLGGARTALVAIVAASVATMLVRRPGIGAWLSPRSIATFAGVTLLSVSLLLLTGLAAPAMARLGDLTTVTLRGVLWARSLEAFFHNPVFGLGPGSFAFVLETTSYFSYAAVAPPHPDNAFAQAAAESGLIGLTALLVLVIGAARLLTTRGVPRSSIWALTFFAVASLGANPSYYPFLLLPLIIWAAIAMPAPAPVARTGKASPVRVSMFLAAGLIGVVFVGHAGARYAHSTAAIALANGQPARAIEAQSAATTLDPSMALYWRELGTMQLAYGSAHEAVRSLSRAVALNASDTTAIRALALAASSSGAAQDGIGWAELAVHKRPSEPENLVMLAYVQRQAGRDSAATATLARALRVSPWLVAADGWNRVGSGDERLKILRLAVMQWVADEPQLDARIESPVWLAFLASRPDLLAKAGATSPSTIQPVLHALLLAATCPSGRPSQVNAAPGASTTAAAWEVQMVVEQIRAELRATTIRLARRADPSTNAGAVPSSILGENAVDVGYGVQTLPDLDFMRLPRELNGRYRVLHELDAVASEIPITAVLDCQKGGAAP